jgi:isochorismate synthase
MKGLDSLLVRQALRDYLEEGRKRAATCHHPVLVSVAFPVPQGAHGRAPLQASATGASPAVFWSRPSTGMSMVGIGQAAFVRESGRERFQRVKSAQQHLLERAMVNAPDQPGVGPVFFSGFQFSDQPCSDSEWEAFGDAALLLPKLLFTQTPGGSWCTLNLLVEAATDTALLEQTTLESLLLRTQHPSPNGAWSTRTPVQMEGSPREAWDSAVLRALDAIGRGTLEKVVLAQSLRLRSPSPFSVEGLLRALVSRYPECSTFAVHLGDAWFLGATPELLVRLHHGRAESVCLAGTARRGGTGQQDTALERCLLGNAKDKNEHLLAVQAVRDSLKGFCRDLRWNQTPELLKLATVQHLSTTFVGTSRPGVHVLDLVEGLHPTPSVAGTPRQAALEFIKANESMTRGWYTGPVGWADRHGDGEFGVAIRCALVRGNQATLYAGAGIVVGSDKDKEWDEVELKFNALLPAFEEVGGPSL